MNVLPNSWLKLEVESLNGKCTIYFNIKCLTTRRCYLAFEYESIDIAVHLPQREMG
jgi:hypothetical protein